jgi:thiosulfate/3-mercaptopyruvate sulfurtransferase
VASLSSTAGMNWRCRTGGASNLRQRIFPVRSSRTWIRTSPGPSPRTPRHFIARPALVQAVSTAEVERALGAGEILLLDARGPDRFAGQNETIDPVAGHVPGARNQPFALNLAADARLRPAPELHHLWQTVLGETPPTRVVAMCGSGVTACHNLLALQLAGLPGARLYAGSFSEWIRDPAREVATGPV